MEQKAYSPEMGETAPAERDAGSLDSSQVNATLRGSCSSAAAPEEANGRYTNTAMLEKNDFVLRLLTAGSHAATASNAKPVAKQATAPHASPGLLGASGVSGGVAPANVSIAIADAALLAGTLPAGYNLLRRTSSCASSGKLTVAEVWQQIQLQQQQQEKQQCQHHLEAVLARTPSPAAPHSQTPAPHTTSSTSNTRPSGCWKPHKSIAPPSAAIADAVMAAEAAAAAAVVAAANSNSSFAKHLQKSPRVVNGAGAHIGELLSPGSPATGAAAGQTATAASLTAAQAQEDGEEHNSTASTREAPQHTCGDSLMTLAETAAAVKAEEAAGNSPWQPQQRSTPHPLAPFDSWTTVQLAEAAVAAAAAATPPASTSQCLSPGSSNPATATAADGNDVAASNLIAHACSQDVYSRCAATLSSHCQQQQQPPATSPLLSRRASLQQKLSKELTASPLLSMLIGRLIRSRNRINAAVAAATAAHSPSGQQQQQVMFDGTASYMALLPGALNTLLQAGAGGRQQQQQGPLVDVTDSASAGKLLAFKLPQRSFVELPAGSLVLGPPHATHATGNLTAAYGSAGHGAAAASPYLAAQLPVVNAAGDALSFHHQQQMVHSQLQKLLQQQQQQQQAAAGSSVASRVADLIAAVEQQCREARQPEMQDCSLSQQQQPLAGGSVLPTADPPTADSAGLLYGSNKMLERLLMPPPPKRQQSGNVLSLWAQLLPAMVNTATAGAQAAKAGSNGSCAGPPAAPPEATYAQANCTGSTTLEAPAVPTAAAAAAAAMAAAAASAVASSGAMAYVGAIMTEMGAQPLPPQQQQQPVPAVKRSSSTLQDQSHAQMPDAVPTKKPRVEAATDELQSTGKAVRAAVATAESVTPQGSHHRQPWRQQWRQQRRQQPSMQGWEFAMRQQKQLLQLQQHLQQLPSTHPDKQQYPALSGVLAQGWC